MRHGTPVSRLQELISDRVGHLLAEQPRVLVGIDGPDAAGKTTLADALAAVLPGPVIRASIDGFHNPRRIRLRQGELSAQGYYRDSFDYPALEAGLLDPFARGEPSVTTRIFDHRVDASRQQSPTPVPARAVLVFDGVFLLRPQLRDRWDLSVYLHVSPEVTLRRAEIRDAGVFGSVAEVRRRYLARYLPGQELYRAEASPQQAAGFLVDNADPQQPRVLRMPSCDDERLQTRGR